MDPTSVIDVFVPASKFSTFRAALVYAFGTEYVSMQRTFGNYGTCIVARYQLGDILLDVYQCTQERALSAVPYYPTTLLMNYITHNHLGITYPPKTMSFNGDLH